MELWRGHARAQITERQKRCLERLKPSYKDLYRPSKLFQKLVELLLVICIVRERVGRVYKDTSLSFGNLHL